MHPNDKVDVTVFQRMQFAPRLDQNFDLLPNLQKEDVEVGQEPGRASLLAHETKTLWKCSSFSFQGSLRRCVWKCNRGTY